MFYYLLLYSRFECFFASSQGGPLKTLPAAVFSNNNQLPTGDLNGSCELRFSRSYLSFNQNSIRTIDRTSITAFCPLSCLNFLQSYPLLSEVVGHNLCDKIFVNRFDGQALDHTKVAGKNASGLLDNWKPFGSLKNSSVTKRI